MSGRKGELIGWWSLLNATVIAMYYITILSWVGAMMIKSFGPLFSKGAASVGPTFGSVLSGWLPVALAAQ